MEKNSVQSYRVLLEGGEGEIIEKKSRFIATVRKVESEEEAVSFIEEMKKKYEVNVLPVNCEQLKEENIFTILENILYEFPISTMEFYMPKWPI